MDQYVMIAYTAFHIHITIRFSFSLKNITDGFCQVFTRSSFSFLSLYSNSYILNLSVFYLGNVLLDISSQFSYKWNNEKITSQ